MNSQITLPPLQANVITSPDGTEGTNPSYVSRLTRLWWGFMTTLVQWVNAQDQTFTPPFAAGNFIAIGGGGSWTVSGLSYTSYNVSLGGNPPGRMNVTLYINPGAGSKIAGAPTALNVLLPSAVNGVSYQVAEALVLPCMIFDNSLTPIVGKCTLSSGATFLVIQKLDESAFAASPVTGSGVSLEVDFKVTPLP